MATIVFAPETIQHIETVKQNARNIATYALPELPEAAAQDVYERITEHERRLASPDMSKLGYEAGSAVVNDEIYTVKGHASGLLTAEHATAQIRHGGHKDADYGVGGLGHVLHEDTGVSLLAMVGRQTGDANYDPSHPFKDAFKAAIQEQHPALVASLHGMGSGKMVELGDERAIDVVIGIGDNPNQRSEELAETVRDKAAELGLKAGINQSIVKVKNGVPVMAENGKDIARVAYRAAGPHTTRSLAQSVAEANGQDAAQIQIELSGMLRRLPDELEFDPKTRVMGAYLGYLITKHLVEQGIAVQ